MFTQMELAMLRHGLECKMSSLRRAVNTHKEPEFKALAERHLAEYTALDFKVAQEKPDEAPSHVSGKKP